MQSLPVELLDPFREASKIFQLLIPADGPSDLMLRRHAALPDDRHVVALGRLVGHDDHSLHDAAHDLLAIRRRRPRGVPERGDAVGERSDPLPVGGAQRRRQFRQEAMVILLHLALLLQRVLPTRLQRARHESVLGLHGVILPLGPLDVLAGARSSV